MTLARNARIALRSVQAVALLGLVAYAAQTSLQVCGAGADPFFEQYVYTGLIFDRGRAVPDPRGHRRARARPVARARHRTAGLGGRRGLLLGRSTPTLPSRPCPASATDCG